MESEWEERVAKAPLRSLVPKESPTDVEFRDLGLRLRPTWGWDSLPWGRRAVTGKRVLRGVSGQFLAGHLNAVMGPSGSGKTTVMNVLAGKARDACNDMHPCVCRGP